MKFGVTSEKSSVRSLRTHILFTFNVIVFSQGKPSSSTSTKKSFCMIKMLLKKYAPVDSRILSANEEHEGREEGLFIEL